MDPKHIENISNTTLFRGIDIKSIPHILGCLDYKVVDYNKSDYIFKVNDPFDGIFIILEGEAAVVKEYSNGTRVIVRTFGIGEVVGEVAAFCGEGAWPATIQALADTTLVFVHPEKILDMCNRPCIYHKIILANMIQVIARTTCLLNKKCEYLMIKSINGKLSKYLLEQKEKCGSLTFKMPLNREKLADFLNISRPSMSRELCSMRDKEIIDFHRDYIRIKDEERLRSLLEE